MKEVAGSGQMEAMFRTLILLMMNQMEMVIVSVWSKIMLSSGQTRAVTELYHSCVSEPNLEVSEKIQYQTKTSNQL